MTILFPALVLLGALVNLPAYILARSRRRESAWLPFISAPAFAAWVLLSGSAYGPQRLSNLVEGDPQMELPFDEPGRPSVGQAIDKVREKFGYDAIHLGLKKGKSHWRG